MNIEMIVGRKNRTGIDKNQYIYKEIGQCLSEGQDKLYLIVPEQFTLGAERELMEANKLQGLIGADVLSFKRLEYRILSEVGGIAKTFVDDHGKQMILQKSINTVLPDLTVYKKSAKRLGFLENICEFISELKQSDITSESLENTVGEVGDGRLLGQKLKDILMIYRQFEDQMGKDCMDSDDRSLLFCEKILESHYLEGAKLWLTGFHTFSNLNFKIIEALAAKVEKLTMVLTCDIDEYAPDASAFAVTNLTLKRMQTISKNIGCTFKINRFDHQKTVQTGLEYLEKNLFSYQPKACQKEPTDIEVVQCKNLWEEVEKGAQKIVTLVRDKGLRYQDIVILAGDIDMYGSLIKRVFAEYDIPFFMDDVKRVTENNFLEAVIAALEIVQHHYTYEDVFSFIKTGFSPISEDESEDLENYTIEFGIRGSAWEKTFDKVSQNEALDLKKINISREKVITPFIIFKKELKKSKTYETKTKALFNFLESINVQESIDIFIERLRLEENYETMSFYNQIWNILMEVFDQIVRTMGDEEVTLEDYIAILKSGFHSYTIGVIPNHRDVVNVIDLLRSRSNRIKVLFVFGLNEGVIPKNHQSFNLLSERERDRLNEKEMGLQNSSHFHQEQEEFTLYNLLTSPEKNLYISFSMADMEGNTLGISTLLGRLKNVFPKLKVKSALDTTIENTWEQVTNAPGTLGKLTDYLREIRYGKKVVNANEKKIWQSVGNWYERDLKYRQTYIKIKEALNYEGVADKLGRGQAIKLFKPPIQASVSRLERYRQCPYAHFVQYGLKPMPRQEYTVEAPDIGTVLHHLIEQFYKRAEEIKIPIEELKDVQRDNMVDEILAEILPPFRNRIFSNTGQNQYLGRKINRISKRTMQVLAEHMRKGSFDFKYSEQVFNQVLKLPNFNDSVKIKGVIDRVDIYEKDGDTFVKVIDYKSGNKKLNLTEIYYGLSLQLLIYMEAGLTILEGDHLIPGGTFYFHVDDPLLKVDRLEPEVLTKAVNDSFKLNGIYLDDPRFTEAMDQESEAVPTVISMSSKNSKMSREEFDELLDYVKKIIVEMSEKILDGDVAIKPYKKGDETGCTYCEYNGICQFDLSIGKASYDVLKKTITKKELFEKIKKEGGNHAVD
ncbi:MAG: PD-(D/E)XK nuclease family protein [Eubacterium sp.]